MSESLWYRMKSGILLNYQKVIKRLVENGSLRPNVTPVVI